MTSHQFGWEDEESVMYVGIFVACQGLLAGFVFAWIGPLSRRIDERSAQSKMSAGYTIHQLFS